MTLGATDQPTYCIRCWVEADTRPIDFFTKLCEPCLWPKKRDAWETLTQLYPPGHPVHERADKECDDLEKQINQWEAANA